MVVAGVIPIALRTQGSAVSQPERNADVLGKDGRVEVTLTIGASIVEGAATQVRAGGGTLDAAAARVGVIEVARERDLAAGVGVSAQDDVGGDEGFGALARHHFAPRRCIAAYSMVTVA